MRQSRVAVLLLAFGISVCGSIWGAVSPSCAGEPVSAEPVRRADRIRAMVSDSWDDAVGVWNAYFAARGVDTEGPQINFVPAVKASHCYGLYISPGPVYCFGNNTVFVSLAELERLAGKIPGLGDPGLAFLVAHELGHHVQKITGRFRLYSQLVHDHAERQRDYALRLELEADCLAGAWAARSTKLAGQEETRAGMTRALQAIGDDVVSGKPEQTVAPQISTLQNYTHGTSEQRVRWFTTGLANPDPSTCAVLEAEKI